MLKVVTKSQKANKRGETGIDYQGWEKSSYVWSEKIGNTSSYGQRTRPKNRWSRWKIIYEARKIIYLHDAGIDSDMIKNFIYFDKNESTE